MDSTEMRILLNFSIQTLKWVLYTVTPLYSNLLWWNLWNPLKPEMRTFLYTVESKPPEIGTSLYTWNPSPEIRVHLCIIVYGTSVYSGLESRNFTVYRSVLISVVCIEDSTLYRDVLISWCWIPLYIEVFFISRGLNRWISLYTELNRGFTV